MTWHCLRSRRPHGARWLAITALLVALGASAAAPPLSAQQAASPALAFRGVTVIDVTDGRLRSDQTVVVVGNRVQAVGPARTVRLPSGAQVVDARGKYLIPGLWDLHTHSERAAPDAFYPLLLANGVTGIRDAGSGSPLDTLLQWRREILAGTRVGPPRQILSGLAIDGSEERCGRERIGVRHICITDSADARHVVDSLKAAGADMIKTYALSRALYFVVAAEARRLGVPFGGHLRTGSFGKTMDAPTMIEALDSGASLLDHTNSAGGLDTLCVVGPVRLIGEAAARLIGDTGARKDPMGGWRWVMDGWRESPASVERCRPVAERFRRHGTWFVPTLLTAAGAMILPPGRIPPGYKGGMPPEYWAKPPLLAHLEEFTHKFWADSVLPRYSLRDWAGGDTARALPDSLRSLHIIQQVGLPILAGTDVTEDLFLQAVFPGFSLHAELAMLVAGGLTPLAALQAATLNPAKFLHGTDSLGTVAKGKLADLVLLDANPLADITNTTMIHAVVANGRYFDRAALDGVLAEARAKAPKR